MDEERDPVPGVPSDEIDPDCPLDFCVTSPFWGILNLEVSAGHPGPITSSGGGSYRSETKESTKLETEYF